MRLQNSALSFVVNFLLGVAWASALLGAVTSFLLFYENNFFWAILSACAGALPGHDRGASVRAYDHCQREYLELQKQSQMLEKLVLQKESNTPQ